MKSLTAVLEKIDNPLRIAELAVPELKHGQVLVEIAYSGVCRSQLNEISGSRGEDRFLPHTLGHEGSGIVAMVGEGVKKVKAGDHVVLTWLKGAGMDIPSCQYLNDDGGVVNSGAISTFLTKAVVSENRVVGVSDNIPLKEAALLGCAVLTGAGIVVKAIKERGAESIGIFGLGGIGLSALLAARMMGVPSIIGVDIFDYKFEKARQLGATEVINAEESDVLSRIMEITAGKGLGYAVECSGTRIMMEVAFQSVRVKGGRCIIAGNLPQGEKMSLNPFDLIKGKQIKGSWGGEADPDIDIPMYADLYLSGKLRIDKLVGSIYSLSNANKALDELKKGTEGRLLLDMAQRDT